MNMLATKLGKYVKVTFVGRQEKPYYVEGVFLGESNEGYWVLRRPVGDTPRASEVFVPYEQVSHITFNAENTT